MYINEVNTCSSPVTLMNRYCDVFWPLIVEVPIPVQMFSFPPTPAVIDLQKNQELYTYEYIY